MPGSQDCSNKRSRNGQRKRGMGPQIATAGICGILLQKRAWYQTGVTTAKQGEICAYLARRRNDKVGARGILAKIGSWGIGAWQGLIFGSAACFAPDA